MLSSLFRSHAAPTLVAKTVSLIISIVLVYKIIVHYTFGFPLLIEGILQIIFSEVNDHKQRRRYQRYEQQMNDVEGLGEKAASRSECVAAVIGYREDPDLFHKCLASYGEDTSGTVRVLVIGIDGNEEEDMRMAKTAEDVCASYKAPVPPRTARAGPGSSEMAPKPHN
ncbi:hypothetical protein MPH_02165 [Macrophomina phaseolina MS6]|uniref:Uncharacterized protein n=1 Tax=Macrophomina phaseolina (strain MS6) TaxID=1126212 RepID=K2S0Y7_MACPH|nr:hypothetical protein MPH_02165 [Macrophomina phaseolina MS6]